MSSQPSLLAERTAPDCPELPCSGRAPERALSWCLDSETLVNLDGAAKPNVLHTGPGLIIGHSGAAQSNVDAKLPSTDVPTGSKLVTLSLKGLVGGHSATNIHEPRMNAIRAFSEIVWTIAQYDASVRLVDVAVGEVQGRKGLNKIPSSFTATISVDSATSVSGLVGSVQTFFREYEQRFTAENLANVALSVQEVPASPVSALAPALTKDLAELLGTVPNGIVTPDASFPTGWETSSNLGVLGIGGGTPTKSFYLGYLPRSYHLDQAIALNDGIFTALKDRFAPLGVTPTIASSFIPAWLIPADSSIVALARRSSPRIENLTTLIGYDEAGVLMARYPHLDQKVLGLAPALVDQHTPRETLNVGSFRETTKALQELIVGFASDPALLTVSPR